MVFSFIEGNFKDYFILFYFEEIRMRIYIFLLGGIVYWGMFIAEKFFFVEKKAYHEGIKSEFEELS